VKPPAFDYVAASSVEEAVALLAQHEGDAKVIAGGQSLVPMLNFRLLAPAVLVDLNRIPGLAGVDEHEGGLRIGALTRHHTLETSELVKARMPVLHAAMQFVAHLAIRNRGTIGGSLSHADPAAELPTMALLLDAEIEAQGPNGARTIAARDFFESALATTLEEDEIVTEIRLPALPERTGWAFEEFARRSGDFGIAGVGATIALADSGKVAQARIALLGVGQTPIRAGAAEKLLNGKDRDDHLIAAAAEAAREAAEPEDDLHGSADYRRHLVGVLVRRAVAAAWDRAEAA
jgi:CO/xanthine dehydrogenase FAD-binding subunit